MIKLAKIVVCAACLLAASASPALALPKQTPKDELSKKPDKKYVYGAAIIIVVGAVGAAAKNAKRSHLD